MLQTVNVCLPRNCAGLCLCRGNVSNVNNGTEFQEVNKFIKSNVANKNLENLRTSSISLECVDPKISFSFVLPYELLHIRRINICPFND